MLIYRILSVLLFPVLELYLFWRVFKKKEDKKRLKERFGHPTQIRPEGELVWVHAVSVGETNSALTLIEELLEFAPDISVLLTTTTLTSAAIIEEKRGAFVGRLIHQFLPIDSLYCAQDFLDAWSPRTAIFIESEIWPNLVVEARRRGILSFLVNARMSEKSTKRWRLARKIGFDIFDQFAAIFAQSADDKKRFQSLTNQEVLLYGNLKMQAQALPFDAQNLQILRNQIGRRKIFLAASTHETEELAAIEAHKILREKFPDLLTIIVPRHPNRADEISKNFEELKLNFARRSKKQNIGAATEIYLADSLGELGIFYRLAYAAFIGGSLVEVGGHNPFEAINVECAVVTGPHVFNFQETYDNLLQKNGCIVVSSPKELAQKIGDLLENEEAREALCLNAAEVTKNEENIAKKIVKKIDDLLMVGV
jgi:3-deoxy-D-manno-octulosonic-acid transferase